jgi:hypothetical protein
MVALARCRTHVRPDEGGKSVAPDRRRDTRALCERTEVSPRGRGVELLLTFLDAHG